MQITLEIPDDIAESLGPDPTRAAIEALAINGYRTEKLSESEVRRILGFESRIQVHSFMADHDIPMQYGEDLLRMDIDAARQLHEELERQSHQAA